MTEPVGPNPESPSQPTTRRQFLGQLGGAVATGLVWTSGLSALAAETTSSAVADRATTATAPKAPPKPHFFLYDLPYAPEMLEPAIDARTMEIHHGRHHKAYVDNLNRALAKHPELIGRSLRDLLSNLDTLPEDIREDVRNNGGGHVNHHLFWEILTPGRNSPEPAGELGEALNRDLGGYQALKDEFMEQSLALFGSGWVFLQVNSATGKLEVASYPNQDCPLMQRHEPLIGLDLWEHAYYLNYRNRRRDYVDAFWTLVNWDKVMDMHGGEQIKL